MGVVIIINFPYSTLLALFLAAASLLLCSFLKCFFGLVYVIFFNNFSVLFFTIYSKRYSKNIRDCSKKSRSSENNYLITSII